MIFWLASAHATDAACTAPTTEAEVDALVVSSLELYREVEVDAFTAEVRRAEEAVACLRQPLVPHLAAEIHRIRGLASFLSRDHDAAQASFAAARAIEPAYEFPASLVPDGNPALDDYLAVEVGKLATVPLEEPASGSLRVDGGAPERHPTLPAFVQWVARDGSISGTWLVEVGAPEPDYPRKPPPREHHGRLAAYAGGMYYAGSTRTTHPGMVSLTVTGVVPLGPIGLDLGASFGLVRDEVEVKDVLTTRTINTPVLRGGLRLPIDAGRVDPWVGAVALVALHSAEPSVTVGGAAVGGLEIGLSGPGFFGVDLLAGYNDGLVAQGGVGVGVRL
ncbi:MAG: hypothetical protein R3F61_23645 [Myxococcota bacterium]